MYTGGNMNLENINIDGITDLESAKRVIEQLADNLFIMNKNIQRQLNHLTSQNIKSIDFNITTVKNADKIFSNN